MVDQASSAADSASCSRTSHCRPQNGVRAAAAHHTSTALCVRGPRSAVRVIGVIAAAAEKSPPPVSTRRHRLRICAASPCGLQWAPGRDLSARWASVARSIFSMIFMVQRRQRHSNHLLLSCFRPAHAVAARTHSHSHTRAATAPRLCRERFTSPYVRVEISATTSLTATRVLADILPAEEMG